MEHNFLKELYTINQGCPSCPSPAAVAVFFEDLLGILFPDFDKKEFSSYEAFELHAGHLKLSLREILARNPERGNTDTSTITDRFFAELPQIRALIESDAQAMFDGDPAARSVTEVVRSYPGFYAIAAYRIAHALRQMGVQLIPRIIAERAHSRTGIDIHPGATIGKSFCIDHGTGVVIGETSHIGAHVKVYQGVTLGGLSVDKADAEVKRHPTIEDYVVIYAGATILGGQTVIGAHSVIGGNVWLTRSVPPHTKVYYKAALTDNNGNTDTIEFK